MSTSKQFDNAHDFPPISKPTGKPILTFDRETPVKFIDLTDTFKDYIGKAGKFLKVNDTENGITVTAIEVESDKYYLHEQLTASSQWLVQHNLNKYPSVTVIDSALRIVICEVEYIDSNSLYVKTNSVFSGKAMCN